MSYRFFRRQLRDDRPTPSRCDVECWLVWIVIGLGVVLVVWATSG